MSCVCIYWNTFVLCSFSCKTDDLIDKMTHYQHSPPPIPARLCRCMSQMSKCDKIKSKQTKGRQKYIFFKCRKQQIRRYENMKNMSGLWDTFTFKCDWNFYPITLLGAPTVIISTGTTEKKKTRQKKKRDTLWAKLKGSQLYQQQRK